MLDQGSSVEPPGNSSGVGAITFTSGTSEGLIGSSSGGQSWSPSDSGSASRMASSVAA